MDPAERQRAVQQLLLSPTVLDRVVREEQHQPGEADRRSRRWLREQHRQNSKCRRPLGLNGRPDPTRGIDLFYLGSPTRSPSARSAIANRLANVFVEENARTRPSARRTRQKSWSNSSAASQARLAALENKLRAKKQTYMGRLPDQIDANVQMVNGARSQLESISMQIRGEQERLTMLESQLDADAPGTGAAMTSRRRGGDPWSRRSASTSWKRS